MTLLSPTEMVFAGFRFARQRPTSILIWSAYYLVVLALAAFAFHDLTGDKAQQLVVLAQAPTPDAKAMLDLMQDIVPAFGFAALLTVVFGAVMRTAIIRSHLEPGAQTWGGLRLGGEELRVLGAQAAVIVMLAAVFMLASLAAGLLGQSDQTITLLVMLVGLVLMSGLGVRLSLAPTIAYAEKRVSLRRAWAMTKGVFWRLMAAYVLLGALSAVVLILVNAVFAGLMAGAALATGGGMPGVGLALGQHFDGLSPILIGVSVLSNLVAVWLSVIFLTVGLGITVQAYRALLLASPKG